MNSESAVLVTGASGLLGLAVTARLAREGRRVIPLCHRHPGPGMMAVDLMQRDAVLDLARLEWDAVVNCAAFRSPDYGELNRSDARTLNAEMPRWLAGVAAARKARLIQISTDYVFPGDRPPYREEDPVGPVNFYGQTKVEAEQAVRETDSEALILRIPALYGRVAPPAFSSLLDDGLAAARSSTELELDDVTVRFPTHVDDVAEVIAQAIGRPLSGVLHVSAGEPATRYAFAVRVCGWLGRETGHLRRGGPPAARPARRPVDCRLATGRIERLGLPVPRPFGAVMPDLLKELLKSENGSSKLARS